MQKAYIQGISTRSVDDCESARMTWGSSYPATEGTLVCVLAAAVSQWTFSCSRLGVIWS
jgi:hypothetical protein